MAGERRLDGEQGRAAGQPLVGDTMDDAITTAAAEWHAAHDGPDMDWDGFTAWLEADPRHATAFDAVALLDARIALHREAIAAQLPADRPATTRWIWPGAGAAALAATLALTVGLPRSAPDHVWQTQRSTATIALADGSRITLAPHSRLAATGGDEQALSLSGAAYFDVPHRPDRSLRVAVGDYEVRDIGTRFEITAGDGPTRVAVAEGQLSVGARDGGGGAALTAGQQMIIGAAGAVRGRIAPDSVGSWRTGQLRYDAAPLALVAADLTRYSGIKVTIDRRVADRRFSGVLATGDGRGQAAAVAAVMGLAAVADDGGVRLEPVL